MIREYASKVDIVYEFLMEELLNGVYKRGDRLILRHIAQQCQMSETPVREAIRRMESEGYIQYSANQGAVVWGYDKLKLTSLVQIKGVLEGYATRLSIDYITAEDIKGLREINDQFRQAYEQNDVKRYSDYNVQFHMGIYACNPNKDLYGMIQNLVQKWSIHKFMHSVILESARLSVQEHEQMLQLIEQKAFDEIEEHVRNHKFRAGYEVIGCLEEQKGEEL